MPAERDLSCGHHAHAPPRRHEHISPPEGPPETPRHHDKTKTLSIVGLVFAAVLCLVCRKRRSSARLNSEDDWQAQWSQVSGAQTPAGGAVELHQVGVRNPMADDREKGFSDVNLGV